MTITNSQIAWSQWGQQITFSSQLVRVTEAMEPPVPPSYSTRWKVFWEDKPLPAPQTGRVVGARYLQRGIHHPASSSLNYDGAEDIVQGYIEETEPRLFALLVSTSPFKKPIFVKATPAVE